MKNAIILTVLLSISILAVNGQMPKTAEEFYRRGEKFAKQGNTVRAEAAFTSALKLDPEHIKSYISRAELQAKQSRFDLAIADYTTIIKINPNLVEAYAGRGELYRQAFDRRAAIADFNQVIRLEPKSAFGYILRAKAYDNLYKDAEAKADFATAIRLEPANSQTYFYRGFMYFKQEKYDLVIPDMMLFLELEDSNRSQISEANIILTEIYLETNDLIAALKFANEAITNAPTSAKAYFIRSLVYRKMNQKSKETADKRKAGWLKRKEWTRFCKLNRFEIAEPSFWNQL